VRVKSTTWLLLLGPRAALGATRLIRQSMADLKVTAGLGAAGGRT
jgi:hypothetical protein